MVKRKQINTKKVFAGLQGQMETKLTFNRGLLNHPAVKGLATELEWIEMLSTYLPKRYSVDSAFVIDAGGNISDQIDIVIFDRQYSPFILKQNGVTYIPAESVYAVIEVKQDLNTKNIEYAQNKAASVRKLKRTSIPTPHAGGTFPPKKPARILAGIVALNGSLTRSSQAKLLDAAENKILNFGCSLTGSTYFSFPELNPWKKGERPYKFQHSVDKNSLVNFFMKLLSELQKVGTTPTIDIDAYLE